MLEYVEPGEGEKPVFVQVTAEEAIAAARKAASSKDDAYELSDIDALGSFIDIHWAWFVDDFELMSDIELQLISSSTYDVPQGLVSKMCDEILRLRRELK